MNYTVINLVDWISIRCGYKLFTTGVSSLIMAVGGEWTYCICESELNGLYTMHKEV